MADQAFIVSGSTGAYSDHTIWPVAVFATEEAATRYAAECQRLANDALAALSADGFSRDFDDFAKANGLTALDPNARHYYDGVSYGVSEAPWFRELPEHLR